MRLVWATDSTSKTPVRRPTSGSSTVLAPHGIHTIDRSRLLAGHYLEVSGRAGKSRLAVVGFQRHPREGEFRRLEEQIVRGLPDVTTERGKWLRVDRMYARAILGEQE